MYREPIIEEFLIWRGSSDAVLLNEINGILSLIFGISFPISVYMAFLISPIDPMIYKTLIVLWILSLPGYYLLFFEMIENGIIWLNVDILERDIYFPPLTNEGRNG